MTFNYPNTKSLLAMELKQFCISVAEITETHLSVDGAESVDLGYHLLWSGQKNARRRKVGLVIDDKSMKCLLSFSPISDRISQPRLSRKPGKATTLIYYAPENEAGL